MEIVSEGSLEFISRPASTSKRCGSRSSVRSASSSVQHSLDILPPEEPTLNWSNKFEVEKDIVVTDVTDDVIFGNEQDLLNTDEASLQANTEEANDEITNSALSPDSTKTEQQKVNFENEEGNYLSANEKTLEVTTEQYENASENIETQPDQDEDILKSGNSSTTGNYDNLDPKVRQGLERIKKLDNILSEKTKREREVKRQRLDQERLWREQLDVLEKNRDAELGRPVDLGPAHMLALGAPQDTDESVYEDSPPVTPLFTTQPLVDEERMQKHFEGSSSQTHSSDVKDDIPTAESKNKAGASGVGNEEKVRKNNKKNKKDGKMRKRDFIKRNILLAADANNMVAMTEEEKKRLEEILSDVGDLMEEPVNKESLILYGSGFVPSQEEAEQLADIDTRLQSLIPCEEYAALCEQTEEDKQSLHSETPRSGTGSFLSEKDMPTFGELVLQEKKEMREMKQRLMAIENQLQGFQDDDHDEGILSESLLRHLLDDSSRTTSQATTIFDRISSTSYDTTSSFDSSSVISIITSPSMEEQ
ncbi:fibrous sheath-interacting protein 1-like isoform X2 [Dendronephthya gigantea]|uniref:fibrous sheath-interacting protein 1-like isoform X2 n=1 Tax=Dendronephthya gigantea TaxID=151771 RepID=UPI00106B86AE|nr:fibrous sheath-interacting protein 1-like isoform X2 [Dendronephthya gigantea]